MPICIDIYEGHKSNACTINSWMKKTWFPDTHSKMNLKINKNPVIQLLLSFITFCPLDRSAVRTRLARPQQDDQPRSVPGWPAERPPYG